MPHPAATYLENRRQFYETLLPRIPEPEFADRLRAAVDPIVPSEVAGDVPDFSNTASPENHMEAGLALDDWLKKPDHGARLGRVTISIREALTTSRQIESVGSTLFQVLAEQDVEWAPRCLGVSRLLRRTMARVLELEDSLRYHRFRLGPPA